LMDIDFGGKCVYSPIIYSEEEFNMKLMHVLTGLSILCFGISMVLADTMECGTHEIEDGMIPGQSRDEIEEKCGTPKSSDGNEVFYEKYNVKYRLHFNDSDELESITEEE